MTQIWITQQLPQDWKRSVFISMPKKDMPKNPLAVRYWNSDWNDITDFPGSPAYRWEIMRFLNLHHQIKSPLYSTGLTSLPTC